jgi:hypothetical protein
MDNDVSIYWTREPENWLATTEHAPAHTHCAQSNNIRRSPPTALVDGYTSSAVDREQW